MLLVQTTLYVILGRLKPTSFTYFENRWIYFYCIFSRLHDFLKMFSSALGWLQWIALFLCQSTYLDTFFWINDEFKSLKQSKSYWSSQKPFPQQFHLKQLKRVPTVGKKFVFGFRNNALRIVVNSFVNA